MVNRWERTDGCRTGAGLAALAALSGASSSSLIFIRLLHNRLQPLPLFSLLH